MGDFNKEKFDEIVLLLKNKAIEAYNKFMSLPKKQRTQSLIVFFLVVFLAFSCGESTNQKIKEMLKEARQVSCENQEYIEKYSKMAKKNPMMELQKDLMYGGNLSKLQHLDINSKEVKNVVEGLKRSRNELTLITNDMKELIKKAGDLSDKDKEKMLSYIKKEIHKPCK